jgi:hypothetical protein
MGGIEPALGAAGVVLALERSGFLRYLICVGLRSLAMAAYWIEF